MADEYKATTPIANSLGTLAADGQVKRHLLNAANIVDIARLAVETAALEHQHSQCTLYHVYEQQSPGILQLQNSLTKESAEQIARDVLSMHARAVYDAERKVAATTRNYVAAAADSRLAARALWQVTRIKPFWTAEAAGELMSGDRPLQHRPLFAP